MQIAMIGLGRMGQNMAQRLVEAKHEVFAFDQSSDACLKAESKGVKILKNLHDIKKNMIGPRAVWLMLPHGKPVDVTICELEKILDPKDIIIDGGNSNFLESIKRYEELKKKQIEFLDIGVSGGVFGLERGYCLMTGGAKEAFNTIEPLLKTLAPGLSNVEPTKSRKKGSSSAEQGYFYCGKSGSGHYVKMIHNAIEYGMMQSYAEGLELLKNASLPHLDESQQYDFDIKEITELWRRGSVVGSWLLDLISNALHKDPVLENFSGVVSDSGEGRWALIEAIKQNTPSPNLANALFTRFRSRMKTSFAEQSLSALRNEFGGHREPESK